MVAGGDPELEKRKQKNQGNFNDGDIEHDDDIGGGFSNMFLVGILKCRESPFTGFKNILCFHPETWGRLTS